MSLFPQSNSPLVDEIFSKISPISVHDVIMKEPKELMEEIIQKHFGSQGLSVVQTEYQEAIRLCIMDALTSGGIQTLINLPRDALSQSIAEDAVAFEATLPPEVSKMRLSSNRYRWRWCYENDDLQKQFQAFCYNRGKANGG